MKYIVFSDVDGTLLNAEHRISKKTEIAIKELEKKNIPFVIVSARSPSGIYPILKRYQLHCPIISYSGALILNENHDVLYHKGIQKEEARKILQYIEEKNFDLSWCLYSFNEWIVKSRKDPRIIREETIVEATSLEGTIDTLSSSVVHKILCICNPDRILEIEEDLNQQFPQFSIVKSSPILLEIMQSGITKATAIREFCKIENYSLDDAVAFGDNYNDVEMLNEVHYGFLMGNAPNELKKRFSLHTLDHNHNGIAAALIKLHMIDEIKGD